MQVWYFIHFFPSLLPQSFTGLLFIFTCEIKFVNSWVSTNLCVIIMLPFAKSDGPASPATLLSIVHNTYYIDTSHKSMQKRKGLKLTGLCCCLKLSIVTLRERIIYYVIYFKNYTSISVNFDEVDRFLVCVTFITCIHHIRCLLYTSPSPRD